MNRERIIEAAYALLAGGGLGALSMRHLADDLGVRVNTIYWHVANKQELLTELGARISGVPRPTAPCADPRSACMALADELRARMLAVRDGAEVVALARARRPDAISTTAALAELAVAAGVDPTEAQILAEAVVVFTVGVTIEEQTGRELERVESLAPAPTVDRELVFRTGLCALLRLLEAGDCAGDAAGTRTGGPGGGGLPPQDAPRPVRHGVRHTPPIGEMSL